MFCGGGKPGILSYTPAETGLWGWSASIFIVHPNRIWCIGVVNQGFHCIPYPNLDHRGGQSWALLYTPVKSGSREWSARGSIVDPRRIWFVGVVSQGSYCISNDNIRLDVAKTQHSCLCSLERNSQKLAQHGGTFLAPNVPSCTLNRFLYWVHFNSLCLQ